MLDVFFFLGRGAYDACVWQTVVVGVGGWVWNGLLCVVRSEVLWLSHGGAVCARGGARGDTDALTGRQCDTRTVMKAPRCVLRALR